MVKIILFLKVRGKKKEAKRQREKTVNIIFLILLNHKNLNKLLMINSPTPFRNLLNRHPQKEKIEIPMENLNHLYLDYIYDR